MRESNSLHASKFVSWKRIWMRLSTSLQHHFCADHDDRSVLPSANLFTLFNTLSLISPKMLARSIKSLLNEWFWDWHSTGLIGCYVGPQCPRQLNRVSFPHIHCFAVSSRYIAIASDSAIGRTHIIELWDASRLSPVRVLDSNHIIFVCCMEFSPSGNLLAVGRKYYLDVWNIIQGKRLFSFPIRLGHYPLCLSFSPDEKTLAWQASEGRNYVVSLTEEKQPPKIKSFLKHKRFITHLENGGYLYIPFENNNLVFCDNRENVYRQFSTTRHSIYSLSLSPKNDFVLALGSSGFGWKGAMVNQSFSFTLLKESYYYYCPRYPSSSVFLSFSKIHSFSPNGKYFVLRCGKTTFDVYETKSSKKVRSISVEDVEDDFCGHSLAVFGRNDRIFIFGKHHIFCCDLWDLR